MVQENSGLKRKFSHSQGTNDDLDLDLNLSLSLPSSNHSISSAAPIPPLPPQLEPPLIPSFQPPLLSDQFYPPLPPRFQQQEPIMSSLPPPSQDFQLPNPRSGSSNIGHKQVKRTGARKLRSPKSLEATIEKPPFLWATNRHATIHNLEYLRANNLTKITGEVQCKKCNAVYSHEFDLNAKFSEVADYILKNKDDMRERAPKRWTTPEVPVCAKCGEHNVVKPVMPEKKEEINWLFLLLGEMLGFCTLDNLKYFCQFTKNHRTGAKDRVLFLAYLALCKQLDPMGPFDR
ncbi:hypothetical protein ACHQM5_008206 [Ranunculus cassubicifolius]